MSIASEGLRRRLNDRVRGDIGVRVESEDTTTSYSQVAVNPATNAEYGLFFFADGDNSLGLGTTDDPTTLDDAVTRAGQGGFVVALGGAGEMATGGVTLNVGQTLIGGGRSIPVLLSDGSTVSFTIGGSDGTIRGTNPANDVITLANDTSIIGVTVTGGNAGIFGDNVSGVQLIDATVVGAGGAINLVNMLPPQPLLAAPGGIAAEGTDLWGEVLTGDTLDSLVAAAIDRWAATGLTDEQLAILNGTTFEVVDLGGSTLGLESGSTILIDNDGVGYGWYIDASPLDDEEFSVRVTDTQFYSDPTAAPAGQYDLLTTLMHELGHVLDYEDTYAPDQSAALMSGWLQAGERRLSASAYTPAGSGYAEVLAQ